MSPHLLKVILEAEQQFPQLLFWECSGRHLFLLHGDYVKITRFLGL